MNTIISICSAAQLQDLRNAPRRHYRLAADIDLEGAFWEPMDFDGTLDGDGKSIFNFRITKADQAHNQGFFGCLGSTACICNLTLKKMTLVAAEDATAIGAFAGINRGKIENCTLGADAPYVATPRGNRHALTGVCDESCLYAGESCARAGAFVGINEGSITGAASYAQLLHPKQGLCGENVGTVDGLYRDVTHRTGNLPKSAVAMRKEAVAHMERQGNFRWIPSKDMAFTSAYTGSFKVYEKDQVHYGLPYTQKNGSLERACYCMEADDYVASWLPGFSDAAKEAQGCKETPWDVYMGNDCSGAVYWSWQRVCPRVEFGYTGDIVPTEENQKLYGVLPLGDYRADTVLTKDVIESNTPEKITQCYTLLLAGDAVVMRDPGYGHIRLVARDPMVMRRQDGSVDINESYVPTHEHGVGKGSSGRLSTWQMDARYTFRELLDATYIPITNIDLATGEAAPVELTAEGIDTPFSGTVRSNYRIISTTVTMTNCQTGQTFHSVEFTALDKDRHKPTPKQDSYARSTVREVQLCEHQQAVLSLPEGEYRYSVSVTLSAGSSHSVGSGVYLLKENL